MSPRSRSIKVLLLVEDNPGDARLLREMFNEEGAHSTELTHAECMKDAERHLAEREVDIILLDLGLPDAEGVTAGLPGLAAIGHGDLANITFAKERTPPPKPRT